jgi:hypothetical protein
MMPLCVELERDPAEDGVSRVDFDVPDSCVEVGGQDGTQALVYALFRVAFA